MGKEEERKRRRKAHGNGSHAVEIGSWSSGVDGIFEGIIEAVRPGQFELWRSEHRERTRRQTHFSNPACSSSFLFLDLRR